jgi:hypothetical protein
MPIPTPEPGLVISYSYLWHHVPAAADRSLIDLQRAGTKMIA